VFDTVRADAPLFGPLLGNDAPKDLARVMHAAWISFARTGDPGWPAYDLAHRATMRFDRISQVVNDPCSWERAVWEGVR
jgi:carboxylesterase type B